MGGARRPGLGIRPRVGGVSSRHLDPQVSAPVVSPLRPTGGHVAAAQTHKRVAAPERHRLCLPAILSEVIGLAHTHVPGPVGRCGPPACPHRVHSAKRDGRRLQCSRSAGWCKCTGELRADWRPLGCLTSLDPGQFARTQVVSLRVTVSDHHQFKLKVPSIHTTRCPI